MPIFTRIYAVLVVGIASCFMAPMVSAVPLMGGARDINLSKSADVQTQAGDHRLKGLVKNAGLRLRIGYGHYTPHYSYRYRYGYYPRYGSRRYYRPRYRYSRRHYRRRHYNRRRYRKARRLRRLHRRLRRLYY